MVVPERAFLSALGAGYALSLAPAHRRFLTAARWPLRAQSRRLRRLLQKNADTDFGRRYEFARIRDVAAYQDRVPLAGYDDFEPAISAIAEGRSNVLTREPVMMLERTSGSSRGPKLIPYTASLLEEFSAFTDPWLYDLFRHRPALIGTTSYWSVSPAGREVATTAGGLSIGFRDDTEYFGPLSRFVLSKLMSVPGEVARLEMDAWRFQTARRLLEDARLGFISVWNPSFLGLLFDSMQQQREPLLAALSPARRRIVAAALRSGGIDVRAIWPRLSLVSAWAHGQAARPLAALAERLGGVEIQPKGLLATEGAVSFPLLARPDGAVVPASGPFVEFVDLESEGRRPRLIHELHSGGRYSPVLTTGGGLYRYRLMDVLECTGHHLGLPLVRFIGRLDLVSDLVGEKVSVGEVEAALVEATRSLPEPPRFALLAPVEELPGRYELYLEGVDDRASDIAAQVELCLQRGHHYRYARDLGQLGSVRAVVVNNGAQRYLEAMVRSGVKLGDVKPTVLDRRFIWHEVFRS